MIKKEIKRIEFPVEAEIEILYCDDCGELMYRDNIVLTSIPPQYSYYCPKCGKTETAFYIYGNPIKSKYVVGYKK